MKFKIKDLTMCGLFVAIISVCSYISFPLPFSTVPVTLQTAGVFLAGLFLSPFYAFLTIYIWITLGALGLPVYANGASGLGVLFGPTGGYIFSFVIAATFISMFKGKTFYSYVLAMIFANLFIIYPIGCVLLGIKLNLTVEKTLLVGMVPYLIGDALKIVLSATVAKQFFAIFNKSKIGKAKKV